MTPPPEARSPLPDIKIPVDLLPSDGRFGCGPSKVRPEAVAALGRRGRRLPRHQPPPGDRSSSWSARLRNGIAELFALPDGYEVLLGNGGTTVFWDVATFGLIERRSQHLQLRRVLLEVRGGRRGGAVPRRPRGHQVARPAPIPSRSPTADVDLYALTHNETSTGVAMPIRRVRGRRRRRPGRRRRHVGRRWAALRPGRDRRLLLRPAEVPRHRRRPVARRVLAGGARADRADQGQRPLDPGVDRPLRSPSTTRRKDQTYNTPALATVFLAVQPDRVDPGQRRPRVVRRVALRPLGRAPSTRGPRRPTYATPVRRRPGEAQPRGRPRSTSTTAIDATAVSTSCGPTASSTPTPTASSAATSCASRCSRPSSPTTSPRSPGASTTSSPP